MIPVFDGHNDFLQRMVAAGPGAADLWARGDGTGDLDLPRMQAGGMVGGFFAIWVPGDVEALSPDAVDRRATPPFSVPLPAAVGAQPALLSAFAQAARLRLMARSGTVQVVESVADIHRAISAGKIAAIMHMEGAEAIADLDALHLWHAAGLRSLGPVWSRPTRYGHGVPFAFPASPDIGDGLTPAGRDLLRECDALRIVFDLSHLNEKGFDDVARLSSRPLIATHSAAHALCPSSRNLTDRQLAVIRNSSGLVGLNFGVAFLREDGRRVSFDGFDPMLRHLDHLIAQLGEDGVALGSDYDGALMPRDLAGADRLPDLLAAMAAHGYGEALIRKIAFDNWINVLGRVWGG